MALGAGTARIIGSSAPGTIVGQSVADFVHCCDVLSLEHLCGNASTHCQLLVLWESCMKCCLGLLLPLLRQTIGSGIDALHHVLI